MMWLASVRYGSALGWCFGGVDWRWVGDSVVWIGARLVGWCFSGVDRCWVCCGGALVALGWCGGALVALGLL